MTIKLPILLFATLVLNFYAFGQNIIGSTSSKSKLSNATLIISGGIGIQTYDSYHWEGEVDQNIDMIDQKFEIIAYPNPSHDFIAFTEVKDKIESLEYNVQIFNMSGVLVRSIDRVSEKDLIDVSILPNAIYLIELVENNSDVRKVFKFIKQNN